MSEARSGPVPEPNTADPCELGFGYPDCAQGCRFRAEADHRIANHLSLLASYSRIHGAEFDGPGVSDHADVRLLAQSLEAQIRAIARLHRLLAVQVGADNVNLSQLLREICAPFAVEPDPRVLIVEDFDADCMVSIGEVVSIGQFVGEAIINAMKHAFPDHASGALVVRSRTEASGALVIEIIDNGPGLPEDFDPARDGGFGLNLMRGIARSLRASLRLDSQAHGLHVALTIPAAPPA